MDILSINLNITIRFKKNVADLFNIKIFENWT